MSWGTCLNASNNIHSGFPALMSTGNFATDWNSACKNNTTIRKKAHIKDNYQYRQFLIKNADRIINKNQVSACAQCCGCTQSFTPAPKSQRYLFKSCSDNKTPYGYEQSDLKQLYLSRQALAGRLVAPIVTQTEMLKLPNWN